jgi:hypothetical protein
MTSTDTKKILAYVRAAYPHSFTKLQKADLEAMVNLWQRQFEEFDYQTVQMALDAIISADTSDFPPSIGKVKQAIRMITQPQALTETEAWDVVKKALKRSGSHSKEEFEALPAVIKRVVRSSRQLRDWGNAPIEQLESSIRSSFMRSYSAALSQQETFAKLPQCVRICMSEHALLSYEE